MSACPLLPPLPPPVHTNYTRPQPHTPLRQQPDAPQLSQLHTLPLSTPPLDLVYLKFIFSLYIYILNWWKTDNSCQVVSDLVGSSQILHGSGLRFGASTSLSTPPSSTIISYLRARQVRRAVVVLRGRSCSVGGSRAGTHQAHRHTETHARTYTSTQAHTHAGTQGTHAHRRTGTQAGMHWRTVPLRLLLVGVVGPEQPPAEPSRAARHLSRQPQTANRLTWTFWYLENKRFVYGYNRKRGSFTPIGANGASKHVSWCFFAPSLFVRVCAG